MAFRRSMAAMVMLQLAACATAPPPQRTAPPPPAPPPGLVVGKPAPFAVLADRSFVLPIAGEVLEARRRKAARQVPLVYTYRKPRGGFEAQRGRDVRELSRWLAKVSRLRVRNMAQFKKAYARYGKVLGVEVSKAGFDRLRRAKRWHVSGVFKKVLKEGLAPYVVSARGLPEKRVEAKEVILRIQGRRGRWQEKRVKLEEVKDVKEVRQALEKAMTAHGAKLTPGVREELVHLAAARVVPSLKLDRARVKAAWVEARSKVKRTPLTFVKGQPVVEKSKLFTAEQRATLVFMRTTRCVPCKGGLGPCSGGLLSQMRLGGRVLRPIRATRSFLITLDEERMKVIREQAREAVPRVYAVDPKVVGTRTAKLKRVLAQAGKLEGDKRWDKLLAGLEDTLGAKVFPQLTEPLEKADWKQVQTALIELYGHAQAEPIAAGRAISASRPCTLREDGRGKKGEKLHEGCPVLPLARVRLDLPLRAGRTISLLAKMPNEAQKALIELVQYLLVGNTTYDTEETKRRRDKAAASAKGEERFYVKGDVVFPAGRPMTRIDRHTLEKMYSLRCVSAHKS